MSDGLNFKLTDNQVDPKIYLKLIEDSFFIQFSHEWFNWYHYRCPWGRSRIYAAWMNDKLASVVAFLPFRFILGDEIVKGSIYSNAMTHPNFRRKGLNVALLEYAKHDAEECGEVFSVTFPTTERYSLPGMLRTGWNVYEDINYWELSRDFQCVSSSVKQVRVLGEVAQPLLDRFNKRISLGVFKSVEYLNWRTVSRPDIDYEIYQYSCHGEIRGLMVLKQFNSKDVKKTHIMELIADDSSSIRELLGMAEKRAMDHGASCLNIWVSDREFYKSQLTDYGFVPSDEKNYIVTLTYSDDVVLKSVKPDHFGLVDNDAY